jgi:branched-subunit amino acid aminotransferase/4-amino-4-deoxychorismate lyase
LIAALPQTKEEDRKLKLVFFRKGPGTYAPESPFCTGLFAEISTLSLPVFSRIRNIEKASSVQLFPTGYSWIKSTSALPYVLAGRERKEKGADEILLCSPEGLVVEGSFSSLCWEDREGIHFTPGNLGGVDSCSRRFLEDSFAGRGISFSEKPISAKDLHGQANWICFSSALGFRFFQHGQEDLRLPGAFSGLDFFADGLPPHFVLPSP